MNATIVITDGRIKSIVGEEKLSEIQKLLFVRRVIENEINDFEKQTVKKQMSNQTNIINAIEETEKQDKEYDIK